MKKTIIGVLTTLTITVACQKTMQAEQAPGYPEVAEHETPVTLSLTDPGLITRSAFFNRSDQQNVYTQTIHLLDLYVFDANKEWVQTVSLKNKEIANNTGMYYFGLPRELCGQPCHLILVANLPTIKPADFTNLRHLYQHTADPHYNSSAGTMIDQITLSNPFVMTAYLSTPIAPYGELTSIEMPLVRLESKIAIETSFDPDFLARYPDSEFQVTFIQARNMNTASYLFPDTAPIKAGKKAYDQNAKAYDNYWGNIFFAWETKTGEPPVEFEITCRWYPDREKINNYSFTPLKYRFTLKTEDGQIKRNHYYKVRAVITGFGENNIQANSRITDWIEPGLEEHFF